MKTKYYILIITILTINSCQVDNPAPQDKSWELISNFNKDVIESFTDDGYLYFTTTYGLHRMTEAGAITNYITVQYPDLGDSRISPKIYSGDCLIPTIEPSSNGYIDASNFALRYYSNDGNLLYTIKRIDYYDPDTYTGILIPSDNNSLINSGKKALLFLSQKDDISSKNFLIEYSITKDINGQGQFSLINKFNLPTNFGANKFIAFEDKYLLSGYNETDIITSEGNFKKILDYSFKEIKSIKDSVFGFTDYSVFFSKDLEHWEEVPIPNFFHGKVIVVDNKLINLSGEIWGDTKPTIIDIFHNQLTILDTKGITLQYNQDTNREDFPKTTAIKEFKGQTYLFTSTGIYSKKTENIFDVNK